MNRKTKKKTKTKPKTKPKKNTRSNTNAPISTVHSTQSAEPRTSVEVQIDRKPSMKKATGDYLSGESVKGINTNGRRNPPSSVIQALQEQPAFICLDSDWDKLKVLPRARLMREILAAAPGEQCQRALAWLLRAHIKSEKSIRWSLLRFAEFEQSQNKEPVIPESGPAKQPTGRGIVTRKHPAGSKASGTRTPSLVQKAEQDSVSAHDDRTASPVNCLTTPTSADQVNENVHNSNDSETGARTSVPSMVQFMKVLKATGETVDHGVGTSALALLLKIERVPDRLITLLKDLYDDRATISERLTEMRKALEAQLGKSKRAFRLQALNLEPTKTIYEWLLLISVELEIALDAVEKAHEHLITNQRSYIRRHSTEEIEKRLSELRQECEQLRKLRR